MTTAKQSCEFFYDVQYKQTCGVVLA